MRLISSRSGFSTTILRLLSVFTLGADTGTGVAAAVLEVAVSGFTADVAEPDVCRRVRDEFLDREDDVPDLEDFLDFEYLRDCVVLCFEDVRRDCTGEGMAIERMTAIRIEIILKDLIFINR